MLNSSESSYKGTKYAYRETAQGCEITIHFDDIGMFRFYVNDYANASTYTKKVIVEQHRQAKKVKDKDKLKNIIKEFIEKLTEDINNNMKKDSVDKTQRSIDSDGISRGSIFIPKDTELITEDDVLIVLSVNANDRVKVIKIKDSNTCIPEFCTIDSGFTFFSIDKETLINNYIYFNNSAKEFIDNILSLEQDIISNIKDIKTQIRNTTEFMNTNTNKDYFSLALQAVKDSGEYNGYEKEMMLKAIIDKNET